MNYRKLEPRINLRFFSEKNIFKNRGFFSEKFWKKKLLKIKNGLIYSKNVGNYYKMFEITHFTRSSFFVKFIFCWMLKK